MIVTTFFLFGCSTPKFYSEIASTYPGGLKKSKFGPERMILNHLQSELLLTERIIMHYSPFPEWDSSLFSGVVYIPEIQKYYYYRNSEENPRDLIVTTFYSSPKDNYYKFIVENYLEGRTEYLQKLGEISNHSGIRTSEVIYDIDLTTGKYLRYVFRDFLFMNGSPTKDVNID